jgi:two-component system, chemotaxis family, CheB/CheR fusion protein
MPEAPRESPDPTGDGHEPRPFPVVGIGGSAGGLEAMSELLRWLPTNTGMAFVLVAHLDPTHKSLLSEILARATSMPVTEAADEPRVEPNHAYVIPPGKNMVLQNGVLRLLPREARIIPRPVDIFFRSLAEDLRHLSIGVVLSGTGLDGSAGLETIKAEGGITFAQDKTALYEGMPRGAIALGCVDFVLPPAGIAKEIARIGQHPYVAPVPTLPAGPAIETDLERILGALRDGTGVDFSDYKGRTLNRRIGRRMVLHKMDGLKDYADLLLKDPREVEALFQDVLIGVTSFFRNSEAFEAVRTMVLPELAKGRSRFEAIRIWVVGCSTGEEAYSLAIEWKDFAEAQGIDLPVQIFATDLNQAVLDRARAGFYTGNILQDVSPERVRRYFVEADGGYRIHKPIRDMCVFARHNVLADPPFSNMDLVSCRNLLIYLEPDLQQRVIPILHYALKPKGFLMLGSSETVGSYRDLFDVHHPKHKIYSRKPGPSRPDLAFPHPVRMPAATGAERKIERTREGRESFLEPQREADRLLLLRYAPAGVLVNPDFIILQFRGETSPYLAPAAGRATLSVLKMAREGLLLRLRSALNAARRKDSPVREEGLYVKSESGIRAVNLEVVPIKGSTSKDRSYLILFEEARRAAGTAAARDAQAAAAQTDGDEDEKERQITHLAQELAATREYLQSVIEQQEASNEELQSSNEEVQSINEELQSINEELETSKEEIQSSNEELTTLNEELHQRNTELNRANDDLSNLLASVQTPIIFVGQDLRIRRFTPAAEKVLNLIATDLGRPIGDIRPNVSIPDLEPLLAEVIDTVSPRELEVQDKKGRWYSLRVRPYKTLDNKIEGAVLMLVDIDALKRGEETLRQQADLLDQTYEPILVWRFDGEIVYWNRGAEAVYGFTREQAVGRDRHELLSPATEPEVFLEDLRRDGQWTGELSRTGRDARAIVLESRMVVVRGEGSNALVLETDHPITERKRMEESLRERARELIEADLRKNEYLALLAHELRNPLASIGNSIAVVRSPGVDPSTSADALTLMERQLRGLARMIDDLIDVEGVTRGKVRLQLEPLDLGTIARRAVSQVEESIAQRGQKLESAIPNERMFVLGDPVRLEQVISNLLHNASKFTTAGGHIRLTVVREADTAEGGKDDGRQVAVLRVQDDGVGIEAEMLPRIFELFVQGDHSLGRPRGGLGIGLTLVRRLVELHGGTVDVRSSGPGQGSAFTVRLPVATPPPEGASAEPAKEGAARADGAPRRVLVVDDIADSADSLAMLVRLSGHPVEVAYNATDALRAITEFKPEIMLLDIGLPGVNGYELARRIRRLPDAENLVLIAVTGYGQGRDRRMSAESGFAHHLTKPVDPDQLRRVLASPA